VNDAHLLDPGENEDREQNVQELDREKQKPEGEARPIRPRPARHAVVADEHERILRSQACSPFQDHRGIRSPSGTSAASSWYIDIVVVVAHAK